MQDPRAMSTTYAAAHSNARSLTHIEPVSWYMLGSLPLSPTGTPIHIFYFFLVESWKNLSVLLVYSYLHSYEPLYICGVSCNLSFLVSNFTDFSLSFFLMSLSKGLSVLFIFSKEPPFSFTHIFYCFHLFLLCSALYDFFLLTLWGFCCCCSFPSCFRFKVRLFIWDFSYFLR